MAKSNLTSKISISIDAAQPEKELERLRGMLKDVNDELSVVQEKYSGDPKNWDPGDTAKKLEKQIKELKKLQRSLRSSINALDTQINGVDEVLSRSTTAAYNELTQKRTSLLNLIKRLKLETDAEVKAYESASKRLTNVQQEIDKRSLDLRSPVTVDGAKNILSNTSDYSVKAIQEAVNVMTKLNSMQKENSDEWRESNKLIQEGTAYLDAYNARLKQAKMEDLQMKVYDQSISDKDLESVIRYWEAMIAGADKGSKELDYYNNLLEESRKLLQDRNADKASAVMADPSNFSVDEINAAIEATKKLQSAQKPGSDQWKKYGEEIQNAKNVLNQFNSEAKTDAMTAQLNRPSSLSTNALAEQKKYWQEMINAADTMSPKLVEYKNNLQTVVEEERTRTKLAAENTMSNFESGSWNKTIGETKEAIKQLQEYRNTLNSRTQAPALEDVDKVLAELTKKSKEAEQGFISFTDALSKVKDINEGKFDGTVEELEQLKKRLQEIRDTEIKLNAPEAKGQLIEISSALDKVENKIAEVNRGTFNLESVLKHLNTASMKDLSRAAEELKKQIDNTSTASSTFIERSARLREVNKRIEEAKELWKEKENIITKTAKRLASYVLVYAGFNEIVGKLKEVARANLELSDSLADIQKTTGLSAESVAHLSDQINAIDTRSAQKELHDLAYEAGKLGISAEEDVLAFVRAGNQLLVALGEDLGGAEAVRQLMKVNAVLGETQKLGVEKALLATGSAINEISQTSRASAGPIADMVKRIGAIGAASHLSMADLVALAGTADAMGQSAEVAGTAFNKFLGTLQTNTTDVAYTLGLDPVRLKEMLQTEETAIYAIIEIFDKMNLMGEMADLSPIMKDLGSEGARMTQVLTTMAAGVGELKAQVFTSRQAFEEATSVTNEYNIKNAAAAAIIERMGNNLREAFTNSAVVGGVKSFLQWLYYLPNALERNRLALFAIRTLLYEIAAVALVKLVSMIGGGLIGALKNATKAWRMLNLEAANSILLNGDRHGLWQRNTLRALAFANGINKVKIAFAALGKVIAANPIFFIGSAIAIAVSAFRSLTEETDKAASAQAEFTASVRKEQFEMENLLLRINKATAANGERASLIQQLNNKYGQYLGFLVTESNYLSNQEYIYKLLNAQIERTIALKMQDKMMTNIAEKYADLQLNAYSDMEKMLKSIKGIGEGGAKDAMNKLMEAIKEQVRGGVNDANEILAEIGGDKFKRILNENKRQLQEGLIDQDTFDEAFKRLAADQIGSGWGGLKDVIKELLDIETKISKEAAQATDLSQHNIESLSKKVLDIKEDEVKAVLEGLDNIKDTNALQEAQSKINDYIREREQTVSGLIIKQKELNSLSYDDLNRLTELNEKRKEGKKLTKDEIEEQERLQSIQDGTIGLTDQEYERMVAINKKKAEGVELAQEEVQVYNELQKKQSVALGLTEQESDQLIAVNAELEKYRKGLDSVESKLAAAGKLSLWGDGKTIKDADVNQLVGMYKKLESDGAKIRKGATESIQTSFWKGFDNQKEAIKWYYKEAEKIKNELESRGYNTSGHFKWGGSDDKDGKRKAREEMQAAISAFEAYWNEYDTYIKQKAKEQNLTKGELDRQMLHMDVTREKERVELYKALLGETNKFNKDMYIGMITDRNYFAGKDLNALAEQLEKWGVAMEDGMRNKLAQAMLKQEEFLLKQKDKIEKLLLQDNFTEQVAQQYMEAIDSLGLLFGLYDGTMEESTKEEGERRMAYMRKWAEESYNITATELKGKMKQVELFNEWHEDRSAEDYEALLIQLRKFHDDQEEADRKSAERRKKIFDNSQKGISLKETAEKNVRGEEENASMWERFQNLDLVTEDTVGKAQIEIYRAKIEASQAYIDQIRLEMQAEQAKARTAIAEAERELQVKRALYANTEEAEANLLAAQQYLESLKRQEKLITFEEEQNIEESRQHMSDHFMKMEESKLSELKKYTDAFQQFAYDVGYAMTDEEATVEEARKAFIKTMLTTLKDYIQIKTTEWVMNQFFAKKNLQTTGEQKIGEMTASAAQASGQVAINSVRATSEEAGSKGLVGLLVGAAIGAALSALLGAALGSMNKAKSDVASSTGASTGRLATGMLTYAEGNYPVLGNDGNVYNAKYEGAGMKTGIYGGGAHFGIFSEKKPEAIIDGDTTQRLILNHPDIWQSIVTLSKTGRLDRGMRTFASGNINELARTAQEADATATAQNNEQMLQMQATMAATQAAVMQLTQVLNQGIHAKIDMYGDGGMYKSMKKAESFASKRGYR